MKYASDRLIIVIRLSFWQKDKKLYFDCYVTHKIRRSLHLLVTHPPLQF